MTCTLRALFAALCLLLPATAFGQGAVLQSGPTAPGHLPQYVGQGSQALIMDGGTSAGGGAGTNPSEFGLTARGTGTPPYAAQGKGPFGTNWCDYDAPITNATGYHFLCMSANAQGGGLVAYGAGGVASSLPLCFIVNGLPLCIGGGTGSNVVTANLPTTPGAVTCWVDANGKLGNCSAGAATLFGNPSGAAGIPGPFTIQGLVARGAPDATNDRIPLYDFASGTIKYVTPGLIAASATAGVSSLGGVTGIVTLGSAFSMVGQALTLTSVGCQLVNFVQSGTGAVNVTCDQLLRGIRVTPEMFGGNCDGTDAGPGIQRAINYAATVKAAVQPSPCTYKIVTPIVDPFGVTVRASAVYSGATFDFEPGSNNQIAYRVRNAGNIVSGGSIENIRFFTNDTTNTKTAIEVEDVSNYQIKNIIIQGNTIGLAAFWGGAGNSIGVRVRGREFVRVTNVQSAADRPFVISQNPNTTIHNDYGDYRDLYLLANGANKSFEIEDGVNFTHMSIDNIACVLGSYCIFQNDTTTSQISRGLSISNLGAEQGVSPSAFNILILRNSPLYGLKINGFQVWDGARNGLYLHNVFGADIQDVDYATASPQRCIDADNTVHGLTLISTHFAGCLLTNFLGQTFIRGDSTPSGYSLPISVWYSSTLDAASLSWQPYTVTATCNSGSLGSGNTFAGSYKTIDGKTYVVRIQATIGASGVGSCSQLILSLPAAASASEVLVGKDATTNNMISGLTAAASSIMTVQNYLGGNVAANNFNGSITGVYEVQ